MPARKTEATSGRPWSVEVRFSGSGGQGIVLAATVFAEAATAAGHEVVMTQSYGPEARGGASKAEVIIATESIDYPEVTAPNITLCLSQDAFDAYADQTAPGGTVICDDRFVSAHPVAGAELVAAAFAATAEDSLGAALAANVVALGFVEKLTGVVTPAALETALRRHLPERHLAVNLRALSLGAGLAGDRRGVAGPPAGAAAGGPA